MTAGSRAADCIRFITRLFPVAARPFLVIIALAFLICVTYVHSAVATGRMTDELAWVDRSLKPLWAPPYDAKMYYYAIHHPSFARLVYRFVLHRMGVYELDRPPVNYELSAEENYARGSFVPREIELPLRLVNVAFLSGMITLVYLAYKRFLGNRALAVAGCLPLLFNAPILTGPCPYIGADAMLLFWAAAFWFAWVMLANRGGMCVFVLAVIGGFLVSTKINGVFTLLGACVYFAVTANGLRRLVYPLILVVIPLGIFAALNPIYRAGDVTWATKVAKDVLGMMTYLKEKSTSRDWGQFSRAEVLRESFPYWLLYIPALGVIAAARREKWFGPTAAWAAATVIPNLFLIYMPLPRYCAVISVGFLVLFSAAGIRLILETFGPAGPNRDISQAPEAG